MWSGPYTHRDVKVCSVKVYSGCKLVVKLWPNFVTHKTIRKYARRENQFLSHDQFLGYSLFPMEKA